MTDTVKYEQDGAVAVISLNRPDSLNGFTSGMLAEAVDAFVRADEDDSVRVVVFTGEGRAFSAGADLKAGLEGGSLKNKLLHEYGPMFAAISEMQKPVIAAVPGFAAGVGMSAVLHSDLVIMADDAFMLSPFTTISLVPDGGLNRLLVRQLGYRRAFQLSVESERIPAERCVELGLANKTVPAAELRDAAMEWASALARRAPLSVAATKKVMRTAMDHDEATCYRLEAELQGKLRESADAAEGVNAFLEKREPDFKGA
ncbi:MAG: enoyl-CoA hydratase-related protein [Woeseiaceae bacterium]|nr:enoyl-CoA hydratase-related protein [Woeseiaceae bacterium]